MPRDLFADEPKAAPRDLLADVPQEVQKPEGSFIEKAKDFGKGLYFGALEGAGGLVKEMENLMKPAQDVALSRAGLPTEDSTIDKRITGAGEAYQDTSGGYGGAGRLVGNIAGTAPFGPALKGMGMLPNLAKTVGGRLGLASAAGAGQGALVGGSMYSPENQGFSPKGAAMGAIGGGIINPIGAALPIIRGRLRNDELVGKVYDKIIGSISQKIGRAKSIGSAENIAARATKQIANKIKVEEKKAWDSLMTGMKGKKVGADDLTMLKSKAKNFVTENADELPAGVTKWVNTHLIGKKDMTFEKLKEMRSLFRDHKDALWKKAGSGDVTRTAAKKANALYDDITEGLRSTAKKNDRFNDFITANQFSKEANIFKQELGGELAEIAKNNAVAAKFVNGLFKAKSSEAAKATMSRLTPGMGRAGVAKELKDLAMKSMEMDGKFNIRKFYNTVKNNPQYEGMLSGTPQAKSMDGLMKLIANANRTGSIDLGTSANFGPVSKLGNNVLRYITSDTSGSLRKNLIQYGLIKKNEKLRKYLGNKITEKFIRAGAIISNDTLEIPNKEQ